MGQALLSLLNNAHESGSLPEDVACLCAGDSAVVPVEALDRGIGVNEAVLEYALVAFYSTKRSGTGLGLALAREIAQAHNRIALNNCEGGGLAVSLVLPL